MRRVLLALFIISGACSTFAAGGPNGGGGGAAGGGGTGAPGAPPIVNVEEDIERIAHATNRPGAFLEQMISRLLPGDAYFLMTRFNSSEQLKKMKKIPTLTLDRGTFTISGDRTEIVIRMSDPDLGEFEINHQRLVVRASMLPFERWLKINDVLISTKTSRLWWPFAASVADQGPAVTWNGVVSMAVVSAMLKGHSSALATKVHTAAGTASLTEIWKKAVYAQTACSNDLLYRMTKWLAALQVEDLTCEATPLKQGQKQFKVTGRAIYGIPIGDSGKRLVTVGTEKSPLAAVGTEQAPDLPGQKMIYRRTRQADRFVIKPVEQFGVRESNILAKFSRTEKIWLPTGSKDPLLRERAEQLEGILEATYETQFCRRCGLVFYHVVNDLGGDEATANLVAPVATPAVQTPRPGGPNALKPVTVPPPMPPPPSLPQLPSLPPPSAIPPRQDLVPPVEDSSVIPPMGN